MANVVKIDVVANTKQAASNIGGLGSKIGGLKVPILLAGAAIAGLGIAAVKMAADFEKSFAEVTTLFDAPDAQIKQLRDDVLDGGGPHHYCDERMAPRVWRIGPRSGRALRWCGGRQDDGGRVERVDVPGCAYRGRRGCHGR